MHWELVSPNAANKNRKKFLEIKSISLWNGMENIEKL